MKWRSVTPPSLALVLWAAAAWAQPSGAGTATVVPNAVVAASCSRAHVQAAVDVASEGGTVLIPAGACSWSSGVTIPDDMGLTIRGAGAPTGDPATIGPAASCGATVLTLTGATAFRATPTYGDPTTRVSCLEIADGSGANIAFSVLGTCTSSGCPSIRIDNIRFTGWAPHASNGISYGIGVVGDVFGVIDHNRVEGVAGEYLQLVQFSHASYLGVGEYGDNSWAQPEEFGSERFLYIENNAFITAGSTELEGSAGGLTKAGGGRVVVRFNTFTDMDTLNFSMGWHGTESYGRPRGTRAFEYYGNTWTCATYCGEVAGARSGTGLMWGNTINHPNGVFNALFGLTTYRALQNIGGWGACDGASPYDSNDGTTYWSGTIASVSGSNPYTLTVSGSPGWTTDQWVSAGSPYSVHDSTIDNGSEITANGGNTLTVTAWTSIPFANGDSIQILRATACLDQAGGRGAGTLYSGDPASPSSSAAQAVSPTYLWANTINHGSPGFGVEGVRVNTARVIRNRDFYVEQINQAAQSSASSPFDGTLTLGIGHGTIARRPATCTTGVTYWATDEGAWNAASGGAQGRLYRCTSTNTWTLAYTPLAYPHPLVGGL